MLICTTITIEDTSWLCLIYFMIHCVHVPLGPLKGDRATQGRAFQPDGDQCWSANSSGGKRGSVGR